MTPVQLKTPAPPLGIIAAVATGFEMVNARLGLILLPLALDLFLWLGPHVSIVHLMPPVAQALQDAAVAAGGTPALHANADFWVALLSDFAAKFNLFAYLSTAPLGLPSLLASRLPTALPGGVPLVWYVESVPQYLLLLGLCVLVGLFLGALYLGGIAQQVRDRRVRWRLLLRTVWGDWARLTALGALALFVVIVLGLPLLLLTLLVLAFNQTIASFVWVAGLSVVLWVLFYGAFALHGMLLHRRGLFAALWDSLRLMQINLPAAAAMFLLVVLINVGLSAVWSLPSDGSWLLLLGVAGHALISTALFTATFVFYQDRLRWWVEMRQSLQARAEADKRSVNRKV